MSEKAKLALVYDRGMMSAITFPVKDIDHAIRLAEAIADSDLLNDDIDFNCFDVREYFPDKKWGNKLGESWESEDGDFFDEYWRKVRCPEED